MKIAFATVFVGALAAASAAGAMTVAIGVNSFGVGTANIAAARTEQAAFHGSGVKTVETFEGFVLNSGVGGNGGPANSYSAEPITTSVGTLSNIPPVTSGATALNPTELLHVRDGSGNNGSRFNTTVGGKQYLDSNDNSGILWAIPGSASLRPITRISFLATDIDDVGNATFNIVASGQVVTTSLSLAAGLASGARPNGELLLFTLLFSAPVNALSIALNIDKGDGFSVDDLTVEQIPLPAAAWLMLTGVGVVASFGRAKRQARLA